MSDTVEERWTRHSEAGRRFMSERKYVEAEKAFLAAIKEARQLGAEDLRMAASLSSLGLLKYKQRDLVQAEMLLRQSLSIRERTLGSEHVGIVQSMSYLAAVYYARGELDRADELFRRALRISEKHLGEDHPDVATMISNLAQLHFKRGDFGSAGQLLTRLLAIREKALGEHHPEMAAILSRLAQVRYAELDTDAAEMLSRRALAIRVRTEGAAKDAAPAKPETAAPAPRTVESAPATPTTAGPRLTSEVPLAPKALGEIASPEAVSAKPAPVRPPVAAVPAPTASLQGWADRLPVERTRNTVEPLAAAPLFSAPAEPPPATDAPYDDDPYGDDLPVTAPRYLTRRIELPWGGMELWKVAAGALLVLGVGSTMLFGGDDSSKTTPSGPVATAPAPIPVPGKSDVVLYSAPGAPKVVDSVASVAEAPQVEREPEPKAAETSAPRRTASTTSSSRPASKPKPQRDEEGVPTEALSASTLRNALKSIDAALDPNSLVSRLARARSAVDSVNRLQVRTGLEPK
ncbi:MAG TPA: tetratricopeptide repeat protein [Gemmatimonadaceae bacterium]|nr:tetratricopeptide repeat protein [Gemmatimonadaceae bacterium]